MTGKAIREALEPFAKVAPDYEHKPDALVVSILCQVRDLRRARTAYDAIGAGVKALEWRKGLCDEECTIEQAHTIGGLMQVRQYRGTPEETVLAAIAEWGEGPCDDLEQLQRSVALALRSHPALPVEEPGEVERDPLCCCGEVESRHTVESGHSFVDAHEHEIERLTRERDEAREELSAFKACHDIGCVEDGYREVIWREATEFFQDECNIVSRSDHEAALAETRERLEKALAYIEEAIGCFDAALSEGMAERLAEAREADGFDPASAAGIFERRVSFVIPALELAREALTGDAQEAGR